LSSINALKAENQELKSKYDDVMERLQSLEENQNGLGSPSRNMNEFSNLERRVSSLERSRTSDILDALNHIQEKKEKELNAVLCICPEIPNETNDDTLDLVKNIVEQSRYE
jgi:predicted nuclease with TOPRIM domain